MNRYLISTTLMDSTFKDPLPVEACDAFAAIGKAISPGDLVDGEEHVVFVKEVRAPHTLWNRFLVKKECNLNVDSW